MARELLAPLQVFERSLELTVALHQATVIVVWRGTPTVAAFKRIDEYLAEARRYGDFGLAIVIEPSHTTPPNGAAREENARISRKYEGSCRGIAMVLEGGSVRNTLVRFAMTTMQLMSPTRFPTAIFDSVRDAALWLAQLDPEHASSETMLAIRHARELPEPSRSSATRVIDPQGEEAMARKKLP